MSEERLSDKMSAKSHAVTDALEVLNDVVIDAMNFNFDAGMQCEQEHIIKLLTPDSIRSIWADNKWFEGDSKYEGIVDDLIALIKGEQK